MFRLRGKGVRSLRSAPEEGDLLCKAVVETPVKLSDEQKELLKQLEDSLNGSGKTHKPKLKGSLKA